MLSSSCCYNHQPSRRSVPCWESFPRVTTCRGIALEALGMAKLILLKTLCHAVTLFCFEFPHTEALLPSHGGNAVQQSHFDNGGCGSFSLSQRQADGAIHNKAALLCGSSHQHLQQCHSCVTHEWEWRHRWAPEQLQEGILIQPGAGESSRGQQAVV